MADIMKCTNKTCPLAYSCYRITSVPNPIHQAYHDFKPHWQDEELDEVECHHYIPDNKNKNESN
jgi:hypothetical protein